MIVVRHISSHLPEDRIAIAHSKERFGFDDSFIKDKLGIRYVTRMPKGENTSDLCVHAFRTLEENTGVAIAEVDCLVVCTQNPDDGGLPHTSAIVHGKLGGAESCAAFDISLGCSGYIYGLSVCDAFMQANGLKQGLLFTADPYSKIIDPGDKNTFPLFGDGATVTLLEDDDGEGAGWRAGRFRFGTLGAQGAALRNNDGRLEMNGRAIFSFAATSVPRQIGMLLDETGLTQDDIDMFLFHQGSKYIVDAIRKRMNLPAAKVPLDLAEHGNTVSSSIPMILEKITPDLAVTRVVLSGFGVGLSIASCILERTPLECCP